MRRISAIAATLAVVSVFVPVIPASGQTGVSASTDRGSAAAGEEITVSGTGWPGTTRVQASVCGNEALALSADCHLPSSRTIMTGEDGSFRLTLVVAVPPSPCPCVVFVSGERTASTVRFPFDVLDAPSAPTTVAPDTTPARAFEVLDSALVGSGPWTAWFGGAASRDLRLTVRNVGTEAAAPVPSVTWGSGSDPTHVVAVPALEAIEPGDTVTYRIPVRVDALSFGTINVAGSLAGPSGPVAFATSSSTYPWGLLLLGAVALQMVLLSIRNRVRDRLHRPPIDDGVEPEDVERALALGPGAIAALPPGEPDDVLDLTEPAVAAELDPPVATPPVATSPSAPPVADPYELDTARAIAASSALASRLRRETDVALMDHHAQAEVLTEQLQRDAAEQSAELLASVEAAHDELQSVVSSTRERTEESARAVGAAAAENIRQAQLHRDEAKAALDEATAHAHAVIGAAEVHAARFAEMESLWQREEQAFEARRREHAKELSDLETRLANMRKELEHRVVEMADDVEARSQGLVESARTHEAELRDAAHRRLVEIVTRSTEISATQIFAADEPPGIDRPRSPVTRRRPAHLAETPKRRFWNRTDARASVHDAGT